MKNYNIDITTTEKKRMNYKIRNTCYKQISFKNIVFSTFFKKFFLFLKEYLQ